MMKSYFADPQHLKALREIISRWEGTPYLHMGTKCRGGVDCAKMVGLILTELGVIPGIEDKFYSRDWHLHGNDEVLAQSVRRHGEKLRAGLSLREWANDPVEVQPGDVLLFAVARRNGPAHHAGIYLGTPSGSVGAAEMFHCIQRAGAVVSQFGKTWRERTRFIFRLLEV